MPNAKRGKKETKVERVEAETKKVRIDAKTERRILRFVNAARVPKDLLRSPQRFRETGGEHGLAHDPEHADHPQPKHPGNHAKINRDLAIEIIRRRPPFGYVDLKQLIDLDPRLVPIWIGELISLVSAASFGEWSPPIPIEVGGTEIPIQNAALLHTGKVPALVHHGQDFDIQTPDADGIVRVVLVRPMAVTHQTDSGQRVISLPFVQSAANKLTATMPNGIHPHGMAPRGYYMLFILNGDGVPSEAKFIHLH